MKTVPFKRNLIFSCAVVATICVLLNCAVSPKYRTRVAAATIISDLDITPPGDLIDARAIYTEEGISSWYGPNFHGNPTANGEIFDMNKVSAAHKDFPLGTWLRVTNKSNNKKILVRVNDRGPFIEGRILDLSRKAAELLDFKIAGLTEVKIEVLRWGTGKEYK